MFIQLRSVQLDAERLNLWFFCEDYSASVVRSVGKKCFSQELKIPKDKSATLALLYEQRDSKFSHKCLITTSPSDLLVIARAWMLLTGHFSKVCALLSAIMMTECGKISWRMLFCDFHPKSTWTKILRIFFQIWESGYDGRGDFRGGGGGGRKS